MASRSVGPDCFVKCFFRTGLRCWRGQEQRSSKTTPHLWYERGMYLLDDVVHLHEFGSYQRAVGSADVSDVVQTQIMQNQNIPVISLQSAVKMTGHVIVHLTEGDGDIKIWERVRQMRTLGLKTKTWNKLQGVFRNQTVLVVDVIVLSNQWNFNPVSYLICKFLRPLNDQDDQNWSKPVEHNLLHSLCHLIDSSEFPRK